MRRLRNLFMFALVACLLLAACGGEEPSPAYTQPTEESREVQDQGLLTILFTGDIQNVFARNKNLGAIGYAALSAYRDMLEDEGHTVVLVDGGGAFINEGAGAVKNGKTMAELIGAVGYDIRVPGKGELSYGVEEFLLLMEEMEDCTYISCNIAGETVFDPYVIVDAGDTKIGFVGITAPDAAHTGYPKDTLDGQALYDTVQGAIDAAADAGADYVIGVGNLGTDPEDSPFTSTEVIANTTGLVAFLDCGSGSVIDGYLLTDKDDFEIPVCAVGSEFHYVGEITLDLNDGSVHVDLVTELEGEDSRIAKSAADLAEELE